MNPAVEVDRLSWTYHLAALPAVCDISLTIPAGEFTLIAGPNEAGKTTLAMAIKGLIPHSFPGRRAGVVRVFGEEVQRKEAALLAKQVGYVFSDPEAQFTSLTVEEEILFGLENIGVPESEIEHRIRRASELTMISDLLDKPPYDISGGQKQRVAIASVLAMDPEILILDEPTSMVDPLGKDLIVEICAELRRRRRLTLIVIEHNLEAFAALADRIVLIRGGRIERAAAPREFLEDPEFLERSGVYPPQVTQVFARLRAHGLYRGPLPLTDEEGIRAGDALLRGAGA